MKNLKRISVWMSEVTSTSEKPVPNDPEVIPAMDADRRTNTNLAPQGQMHPDARPESKFTPEGDQEPASNIPPSATDPE